MFDKPPSVSYFSNKYPSKYVQSIYIQRTPISITKKKKKRISLTIQETGQPFSPLFPSYICWRIAHRVALETLSFPIHTRIHRIIRLFPTRITASLTQTLHSLRSIVKFLDSRLQKPLVVPWRVLSSTRDAKLLVVVCTYCYTMRHWTLSPDNDLYTVENSWQRVAVKGILDPLLDFQLLDRFCRWEIDREEGIRLGRVVSKVVWKD